MKVRVVTQQSSLAAVYQTHRRVVADLKRIRSSIKEAHCLHGCRFTASKSAATPVEKDSRKAAANRA